MDPSDGVLPRWGAARDCYTQSFHEVTDRVRDTFRTSVRDRFRASLKQRRASKNAASVATGLVAARVFKGNLVVARVAKSTCLKLYGTQGDGKKSAGQALAAMIAFASAGAVAQADSAAQLDDDSLASKVSGVYEAVRKSAVEQLGKEKKPEGVQVTETALEKRRKLEELEGDASPLQKTLQAVALPALATLSKAFMLGLNNTEIHGAEKLVHAIRERPQGTPLVTVCNHVAAMDDPLVLAAVVPEHLILDAHDMRWTLCASDRCFKNPAMSAFFRAVKVLPVERGAGLEQKGMESALAKLDRGEWVHLFPEGSRSRDGGKTIQPIKRGVGRLVAEAKEPPVVLPFVHLGMEGVIPRGAKVPAGGNNITVLIGDPVPVADLITAAVEAGASQTQLYDAIAARVGVVLVALKAELENVAAQSALERAELEAVGPALADVVEWEEDTDVVRLGKALLREKRQEELSLQGQERLPAGPPAYSFESLENVFGKRGQGTADSMPEEGAFSSPQEPVDAYAGWTSLDEETAMSRALAASFSAQEQAPLGMVGFAAQAFFKAKERGREFVPEGWRRERRFGEEEREVKVGRVRSFLRDLKDEPKFEGLRTQLKDLSSRVNDHFGSSVR